MLFDLDVARNRGNNTHGLYITAKVVDLHIVGRCFHGSVRSTTEGIVRMSMAAYGADPDDADGPP